MSFHYHLSIHFSTIFSSSVNGSWKLLTFLKNSMQIEIEGSNEKKKKVKREREEQRRLERGRRKGGGSAVIGSKTTTSPLDVFFQSGIIFWRDDRATLSKHRIFRRSSSSNNISFANKRNAFRPSRSNFVACRSSFGKLTRPETKRTVDTFPEWRS